MTNNINLMKELSNQKKYKRNCVKSFLSNEKKRKKIGVDKNSLVQVDDENRLFDRIWNKENCFIYTKNKPKSFINILKNIGICLFEKLPVKWKMKIWYFLKKNYQYPHKDIQEIRFTETSSISLKNVVYFGDFSITVNTFAVKNLDVDIKNSLIFGTLNIYCVNAKDPYYAGKHEDTGFQQASLHCYSSAIDEIRIRDSQFHSVDLDNVSVGLLSLQDDVISNFCLYKSNIESFKVKKSEITTHLFKENQINIDKSFSNHRVYKWKDMPPAYHERYENGKKEEQIQIQLDTKKFFYANQSSFTQSEIKKIDYQYGKIGMNAIQSFIYWLTGGMMRPRRIFVLLIIVLIIFALIYYLHPGAFGPKDYFAFSKIKQLLYSLYFSAVTLTTTGYGDLHPNEDIMFWASIESLTGILLGGAFLVSLTRSFFEKKDET